MGTMPAAISHCGRPAASTWVPSRPERSIKAPCGTRMSRTTPVSLAAAPGGGGGLVDPSAGGPRRVVVPQRLDPAMLEDVRKAEAVGPRVSSSWLPCIRQQHADGQHSGGSANGALPAGALPACPHSCAHPPLLHHRACCWWACPRQTAALCRPGLAKWSRALWCRPARLPWWPAARCGRPWAERPTRPRCPHAPGNCRQREPPRWLSSRG